MPLADHISRKKAFRQAEGFRHERPTCTYAPLRMPTCMHAPADCGPASAVIGNWAVSAGCSWFGEEVATAAACEAMCVAAGATHCQWGLLAPTRRSCLAHFEVCPGDCQLLPNSNGTQTDNLVWRSCYRGGDPVKPRVCPGKEDVLAVPLKRARPGG